MGMGETYKLADSFGLLDSVKPQRWETSERHSLPSLDPHVRQWQLCHDLWHTLCTSHSCALTQADCVGTLAVALIACCDGSPASCGFGCRLLLRGAVLHPLCPGQARSLGSEHMTSPIVFASFGRFRNTLPVALLKATSMLDVGVSDHETWEQAAGLGGWQHSFGVSGPNPS